MGRKGKFGADPLIINTNFYLIYRPASGGAFTLERNVSLALRGGKIPQNAPKSARGGGLLVLGGVQPPWGPPPKIKSGGGGRGAPPPAPPGAARTGAVLIAAPLREAGLRCPGGWRLGLEGSSQGCLLFFLGGRGGGCPVFVRRGGSSLYPRGRDGLVCPWGGRRRGSSLYPAGAVASCVRAEEEEEARGG